MNNHLILSLKIISIDKSLKIFFFFFSRLKRVQSDSRNVRTVENKNTNLEVSVRTDGLREPHSSSTKSRRTLFVERVTAIDP